MQIGSHQTQGVFLYERSRDWTEVLSHSDAPRSLFQISPWQATLLKETRLKTYAEFQTELTHNSSEQLEVKINVKQGMLASL